LLQTKELSKTQQRYIRYKLRKKIKQFYSVELPLLTDKGYIVNNMAANSCGVAASSHDDNNNNKSSAGSGTLVPPSHPQEGREGNISNPRVLSDMGLAILI
jgi:hypothetical protein